MGLIKSSNKSIRTNSKAKQVGMRTTTPIQKRKSPPRQMPMGRRR